MSSILYPENEAICLSDAQDASLRATILIHETVTRSTMPFARRSPYSVSALSLILSFINAKKKRKKENKKGRRRQIDARASATERARKPGITGLKPSHTPNVKLSVRNLHCCVSLSRVGRRGRHIPGAEAGRRDPWQLDKLTTYASHSRTSLLWCSTFVSEGLLPSLFLVHLW